MSLATTSVVVVLTLALDITAFSAPRPEEPEREKQALLTESLFGAAENDSERGNFAFRLEGWLGENGSGGFPPNFSDEYRRLDPWEEPPQ